MNKFVLRLFSCLTIFSLLFPLSAAQGIKSFYPSHEPLLRLSPEMEGVSNGEVNQTAKTPSFTPSPPLPPTPEQVREGKDPFLSKPPYAYYYYGTNSQPINLVPSANIILVNTSAGCLGARQNLDSELSKKDTSINSSDTFKSSNYSMIFLSNELKEIKSGQSFESIFSASDVNCILPVIDREDYYLYATDEIIVKFKKELTQNEINTLISEYKLVTLDDDLGDLSMFLFQVSPSPFGNAYDVSNDLVEKGYTEFAHPNFAIRRKAINNPPQIEDFAINEVLPQWNLERINAAGAWSLLDQAGISPHSVKVAVIDSGVKRNHEDLSANIGPLGYDAVNDQWGYSEGEPREGDPNPHGTGVAGIIAADATNNIGVSGIANNYAEVVPIIDVDDDDNRYVSYMIRAISAAYNHEGVRVINISQGVVGEGVYPALHAALNDAYYRGIVVVAASGNENDDDVMLPAAHQTTIAVGATTENDERKNCLLCFLDWGSNYGDALDIVAPGVSLATTALGIGPFKYSSSFGGTSGAAPQVAAVAAMMLAANPNLTPSQVQDILQRTAEETGPAAYSGKPDEGGWNKYMGFGRLNAYEAVRAAFASKAPRLTIKVNTKDTVYDQNSANDVAIGVFGKYYDNAGRHPLLSEGMIRTDDAGNSIGSVSLLGIATGNYMVCAKPFHYLWTCLPATLTTDSTTFLDFTSGDTYVFKVGDFNVDGEDGVINSHDREHFFKLWVPCIWQGCDGAPLTEVCKTIDFMRNNCINSGDYVAIARNYRKISDGFFYGGGYWKPFKSSNLNNFSSEPTSSQVSSTGGSLWLTSDFDQLSVGSTFTANVMLDLTDTTLGSGSSNVNVYYDPGVLQVVDSNPDIDGVQIQRGDLFPIFDYGTVDQSAGIIVFGGQVGTDATEGINSVGALAMITFQVISSIPATEVSSDWRPSETIDSNAAEFHEGNDLINSASPLVLAISGSPSRVLPSISISVPQGSYIGTFTVPVTMDVYDPFDQVRSVDLLAYYDEDWHPIGTDLYSTDGWVIEWDTTGVADQVIWFYALANLPGGTAGTIISDYVILDRTAPYYLYHAIYNPNPTAPSIVEIYLETEDNLSGVEGFEMYVNSASDGSSNGDWIFVNGAYGPSGTIIWDSSEMSEGFHQIAFAILDFASNWNRWDSEDEPTITYGQSKVYLPAIQKFPQGQWNTLLYEGFEGDFPGNWQIYDFSGQGFEWSDNSCSSSAGSWSGWAMDGGIGGEQLLCGSNYVDNSDTWMVFGPINLSDASMAVMSFDLWLNTELNFDFFSYGASEDGSAFQFISESGNSTGWVNKSLNLADVNGQNFVGKSHVWIGFKFETDSSVNYPVGAVVDEVLLRKCVGGVCP